MIIHLYQLSERYKKMRRKLFLFILIIFFNSHFFSFGLAQENNYPIPILANLFDSTALTIKTLPFIDHPNLMYDKKSVQDIYKNKPLASPKLHHGRLVFASLLLISLNYTAYQPFKNVWWEEERTHFHFYRGWRRNNGYWDFGWHDTLYGHIDKLGHYYSARLLSEHLFYVLQWSGFNKNSSKFIGPILSSLLMLEIEIYDSFFKEWGFSLADFTANELGAFSPLIREKVPSLNNFQLKFSYHRSHQPKQETTFIKDYAGMTFWLSYNIYSLLPVTIKKYYPSWLNLALGYSVSKPTRGKVELYLAPDINWLKVPFGQSKTLIFMKKMLNHFHFPCFCLKLIPDNKFYLIYF